MMERKKIGLALSGGGARGFAHIGVLKVLAEHGIAFDMIAGTSAGSLVGGALAAGMTPLEIEAMAKKVGWLNMMRPSFGLQGVMSNAPMGEFLKRELPIASFEDLPIPFAAVAYDLAAGEEVILKDGGDLAFAIRASCSVPGAFAPVRDGLGRVLVDGGVTSILPVDAVRDMGADIVIAIDVIACGASFRSTAQTGIGIMTRSVMTLIRSAANNQNHKADLTIVPQIAHLRPDQIGKREEFITLGESAGRENIPQILSFTQQT